MARRRSSICSALAGLCLLSTPAFAAPPDQPAPSAPTDADADAEEFRAQAELIEALDRHVVSLGTRLEFPKYLGELRARLDALRPQGDERILLRSELSEIEAEIHGFSDQPGAYRGEFLTWVRLSAEGEKYPQLLTRLGRVYREVVVRRVTDIGLEFRHAEGSARLHYHVLPAEIQQRFRWRADHAQAALREEAHREAYRERLHQVAVRAREELPPFESRLDSLARPVPLVLEPSAPIETRRLEPSAPLVLRTLEFARPLGGDRR